MKGHKNVLIPVDFNPTTENTISYVSHYADHDDHLILLHVMSQGFSGLDMVNMHGPYGECQKSLTALREEQLKSFKNVTTEVKFDPLGPVDGIQKYVAEHDVDLVFMGTRDKHDIFDQILGSTSFGIVKGLSCDVVVIPPKATYRPLGTIVLGAQAGLSQALTKTRLQAWAGKKVLIVHVGQEEDEAYHQEQRSILSTLFQENEVDFAFGMDEIRSDDVVKSLLSYSQNEKADVIILQRSSQGLLSSLFLKSVTKEMIEKATLPIVFIN